MFQFDGFGIVLSLSLTGVRWTGRGGLWNKRGGGGVLFCTAWQIGRWEKSSGKPWNEQSRAVHVCALGRAWHHACAMRWCVAVVVACYLATDCGSHELMRRLSRAFNSFSCEHVGVWVQGLMVECVEWWVSVFPLSFPVLLCTSSTPFAAVAGCMSEMPQTVPEFAPSPPLQALLALLLLVPAAASANKVQRDSSSAHVVASPKCPETHAVRTETRALECMVCKPFC